MKGYIYQIRNIVTDKLYIGSTKNIKIRKGKHFSDLKCNRHHCIYLQRSYDKHGIENFVFEIVSSYDVSSEIELLEVEQKYLDLYDDLYNTSQYAGGGDNLSYHPKKKEIIKKISSTLKKINKKLSAEERKEKYGRVGELNGMYGKSHSDEVKKLLSEKLKLQLKDGTIPPRLGMTNQEFFGKEKADEISNKLSEFHKTLIGNKNPFFGKYHSEKTKQKLSKKAKIRFEQATPQDRYNNNPQIRQVMINGTMYYGVAEAARQLDVSVGTICYRIKSNTSKFEDYAYINREEYE